MFKASAAVLSRSGTCFHPVSSTTARYLLFAQLTFIVFLAPRNIYSQAKASSGKFAELSRRAAEAREADRVEEAVRLYRQALALRPNWQEGWWSLGTLEYDLDHYSKAALDFEKVIALNSTNGTAHAMLGLSQFELGQDNEALKNLLAAERLSIVNDDQLRKVALYHLGLLELRARRFGDAHDTLQQLAQQHVRTQELAIALGKAALLISSEDKNSDVQVDNIIAQTGEADALAAVREFERAKQIYQGLIERFPNYPNLHFAFGRALLEAQETEAAVAEFQRELDRDPGNVNSMLEIASVRYRVDSQEGLKYAENAAKLAPAMPFAHYLLGLLRLDTGNPLDAIPELEIAKKAFPKQSEVYFALGNAYARAGRKTEAARTRAEFLRLEKQSEGQPGSNVYGQIPPGLSEGQMRTESNGASPD